MTGPVHAPVMLAEVLDALQPAPGRLIVDGTFGAGGYTLAILQAGAGVLALDRDPSTARYAEPLKAEFKDRFAWSLSRFSDVERRLVEAGRDACEGVTFDLGVSSMQLDEAERGFSFMREGPLDMRMGADGQSAADLVNAAEPGELVRILRLYGEEPKARRIVQVLTRRRIERPFLTTLDLAETVERARGRPPRRQGPSGHPHLPGPAHRGERGAGRA